MLNSEEETKYEQQLKEGTREKAPQWEMFRLSSLPFLSPPKTHLVSFRVVWYGVFLARTEDTGHTTKDEVTVPVQKPKQVAGHLCAF